MQSLRTATRQIARTTPSIITRHTAIARTFSQSRVARGGGHGSQYDPPSGWLFGVKPGEQYEKEGWEGVMFWGFGGACVFGVVAYAFKPDTRYVAYFLLVGIFGEK